MSQTIFIATRGSALALAQANTVLGQCRGTFPDWIFQLKVIKTTGDKLQTASLAQEGGNLPKGLFTKELEVALLKQEADIAVHSLKDLPTELPTGLKLGAVGERADVRDVLIYRDKQHGGRSSAGRGFDPETGVKGLPPGSVVATSSTRRRSQLLSHNPELKVPDIRGNVLTRIIKLAENPEFDATVLALAGLTRLKFTITAEGYLRGEGIPDGLLATVLDTGVMLPCVGQGAVGIETREADGKTQTLCKELNHFNTHQCVAAERAFLAGMGGGCQSPVAALAEVDKGQLAMRALSFAHGPVRRATATRSLNQAVELGQQLAAELKAG